jgi:predicted Zn-dependent protease
MRVMEIHVAILPAPSPDMRADELGAFARRLGEDVTPALEEATGLRWVFHIGEMTRLSADDPRRPSDFLDTASLRMVEGPYDAVVVVTDVALVSQRQRVVPGLVSAVGRVLIVSMSKFRVAPRGEPFLPLDAEAVRWNAATLLLHLLGHALGLDHRSERADTVMAPFAIDPARRNLPTFSDRSRKRLRRLATEFPEREDLDEGTLSELVFHLASAARHPRKVLAPVWRSRAPLLPLYLPRLTTAAVAPAFILVFTAEIWDAGFHMTDRGVWLFALLSILASTVYLSMAQNLFLPHKEKRYHTEHLAVVNVAILLVVLFAVVGLFFMLVLLMLAIQVFIFPPDLVREWPSLELGSALITIVDQVRIAALISTIGVLTGTLAGGLESRDMIRHLALFQEEP